MALTLTASLPATNAKRLRKGAKRRSNPCFHLPRHGLLRFARNDGTYWEAVMRYLTAVMLASLTSLFAGHALAADNPMTIAVFTKNRTNPAYEAFRIASDQIARTTGVKAIFACILCRTRYSLYHKLSCPHPPACCVRSTHQCIPSNAG